MAKKSTKYDKYIEKCIEADMKQFAEDLEDARVNYPEVYEMFLQLKAETEEIEKKEGLAAALRHIVKAREDAIKEMCKVFD